MIHDKDCDCMDCVIDDVAANSRLRRLLETTQRRFYRAEDNMVKRAYEASQATPPDADSDGQSRVHSDSRETRTDESGDW